MRSLTVAQCVRTYVVDWLSEEWYRVELSDGRAITTDSDGLAAVVARLESRGWREANG